MADTDFGFWALVVEIHWSTTRTQNPEFREPIWVSVALRREARNERTKSVWCSERKTGCCTLRAQPVLNISWIVMLILIKDTGSRDRDFRGMCVSYCIWMTEEESIWWCLCLSISGGFVRNWQLEETCKITSCKLNDGLKWIAQSGDAAYKMGRISWVCVLSWELLAIVYSELRTFNLYSRVLRW